MKVVTRFAPSPTGLFHAGSYRTALFAYIFARQNEGKFVLRIEDTDKERSKKEYEDNIMESLSWLGLDYDSFYRQSERTVIYKKYLEMLIEKDFAYISEEETKDQVTDDTSKSAPRRKSVIRFRNPGTTVVFDDIVRGKISFDTKELGDFVIAKSMDEPVFHLVNVIDDYEMGITHIIRGEDHISNTPRQILIFRALGANPPLYAHIPLLLAKDRSKLSKRHGALSMTEYKKKGYLPEALLNYMSLLGWHPKDDREVMPFSDIVKEFSLERVQKSGAIFDEEKLAWLNRQYLIAMNNDKFKTFIAPYIPQNLETSMVEKLTPIIKDKISCFADIASLFEEKGELSFVSHNNDYDGKLLLWAKNPDKDKTKIHLQQAKALLSSVSEDNFTSENIKSTIWPYAEENGKGNVLWPLRVALTGQEKSPDPVICAYVLGKDRVLNRIDHAIQKLT